MAGGKAAGVATYRHKRKGKREAGTLGKSSNNKQRQAAAKALNVADKPDAHARHRQRFILALQHYWRDAKRCI